MPVVIPRWSGNESAPWCDITCEDRGTAGARRSTTLAWHCAGTTQTYIRPTYDAKLSVKDDSERLCWTLSIQLDLWPLILFTNLCWKHILLQNSSSAVNIENVMQSCVLACRHEDVCQWSEMITDDISSSSKVHLCLCKLYRLRDSKLSFCVTWCEVTAASAVLFDSVVLSCSYAVVFMLLIMNNCHLPLQASATPFLTDFWGHCLTFWAWNIDCFNENCCSDG